MFSKIKEYDTSQQNKICTTLKNQHNLKISKCRNEKGKKKKARKLFYKQRITKGLHYSLFLKNQISRTYQCSTDANQK